jgi:glucosamine--fructose-6-phosphate aminotransferase (isomerizing)
MNIAKGFYTRQEILSQPEAWCAAFEELKAGRQAILDLPAGDFDQIVFTGCGSTYYLALAAAPLTQALTGLPARAFPASELWLYPRSSYTARRDRKSVV